jgi:hypothetical protein
MGVIMQGFYGTAQVDQQEFTWWNHIAGNSQA